MTTERIVLEVPHLAGPHIHLRPWVEADAPLLVAAWGDVAIQAGSTPPPDRSLAAAQTWIEGVDERRKAGLAFDLVIADESDQVVGEVGLSNFDAVRCAAVIGWWVHEEHRGQGLAKEAVRLFVEWALSAGELRALMAEIAPTNGASIRVAEAAGFSVIDDSRYPQESARGRAPRVWYVAHSTVK